MLYLPYLFTPLNVLLSPMCFKQDGGMSTLNVKPLKLVDPFTYLSSNISSAKSVVDIGKAYAVIDRLLFI